MDSSFTRGEHEEFRRSCQIAFDNLSNRIDKLEDTTSVIDKLATNMANMLDEQLRQGERLDELESKDGEMWRSVVMHSVTTAVGIIVGFILSGVGF